MNWQHCSCPPPSPAKMSNITKKRRNFSQAEKEIFVRVFRGISNDFPDLTKQARLEKTTEYTGCAVRSLERILAEEKTFGRLHPPKKAHKECRIKLDERQNYLVRSIVHSFFFEDKIPTIDAVHKEVEKIAEIPNMSRSKLYKILRELGFSNKIIGI